MRSYIPLMASAFLSLIFFAACKKEVNTSLDEQPLVISSSLSINCRSIGLALATRQNDGSSTWKNLLLKWYDDAGRLQFVKFDYDWFGGTQCCPDVAVEFGELTYTNDEVHLRDVNFDQEILRIKLDGMRRPITSWYNGYGRAGQYQFDTSYYYYSSANRLETVVQHKRFTEVSEQTAVETWNFSYDPDGNLTLITRPGKFGGYEFRYDYTQLNHGMETIHMLSGPVKALEFLDLIKFEQHHRISRVIVYDESGATNIVWSYGNLGLNAEGQVTSYTQISDDSPQKYTWYTAWDCNGTNMLQSKNPTQSEFMKWTH